MSNTYTPAAKLAMPASGDRVWNTALNANVAALDAVNAVGGLACSSHEQPSASLLVDIAPGAFIDQGGAVQTYAGVSGQAIALSSSKALYLDGTASWALVVTASSFPATAHIRIANVVAGVATVASIVDARQCFTVCGSVADGVTWPLGTATGLKIGTSTSQKLAFFGATPCDQPVVGAAVAGATYTSAEQAILNAVVAAVRELGLGS